MRLSPGGEFLFVSTRRCATATMFRELGDRNWRAVGDEYHAVPSGRMAEVHFTLCRNPYTRALSIWKWADGGLELMPFLDKLTGWRDIAEVDRWMYAPCAAYHDLFLVDRVLKLEEMPGAFEGLKLEWEAKLHATAHPEPEELSAEALALIREWGEPDFERYGYAR